MTNIYISWSRFDRSSGRYNGVYSIKMAVNSEHMCCHIYQTHTLPNTQIHSYIPCYMYIYS